MKLLYCSLCGDVHGLVAREWRKCFCGESGGQYNADLMTATIGGAARVFGIGNSFFNELWPWLTEERKVAYRQHQYKQSTDAWWGEYPGEVQIFRIASADGPRLKVRVKILPFHQNEVRIIDKRSYTIDSKGDVKFVTVPANPKPSFKKR